MDTVSLEIAKKLKEAGWKQENSAIAYFFDNGSEPYLMDTDHWSMAEGEFGGAKSICWKKKCTTTYHYHEALAAPTIGELAHALPTDIHIDKLKGEDGRECYRVTLEQDEKMDYDCMEETLADTLGECMVRLMKDGYKPYV